MSKLIKPNKLSKGDTVAIVSLSSGLAGEEDMMWRTNVGIERLKDVFGLKVKIMPNALKGSDFTYNHPEKEQKIYIKHSEILKLKQLSVL